MDTNEVSIGKVIITGILIVFGIILFFGGFYQIDAGQRGVLLTFGQANPNAIQPGLHLKIPLVQQVVGFNVKTQKYEADATAASQDLQIVTAKIATNYHILPEKAPQIYTQLGTGYADSIIMPMEQEVVKATTAQFTAEQLITKREQVRLKIKETLTERLLQRDIVVEEVSIVNFDFSKSFNDAIEAKVTAEQNALKEQNNLEVIKYQAQQKVEAAKGEATAIQTINTELSRSPTYIEYLKVTKWNGQLPSVTSGMPFIDVTAKSNINNN